MFKVVNHRVASSVLLRYSPRVSALSAPKWSRSSSSSGASVLCKYHKHLIICARTTVHFTVLDHVIYLGIQVILAYSWSLLGKGSNGANKAEVARWSRARPSAKVATEGAHQHQVANESEQENQE